MTQSKVHTELMDPRHDCEVELARRRWIRLKGAWKSSLSVIRKGFTSILVIFAVNR